MEIFLAQEGSLDFLGNVEGGREMQVAAPSESIRPRVLAEKFAINGSPCARPENLDKSV
jgi:hypothetical protein